MLACLVRVWTFSSCCVESFFFLSLHKLTVFSSSCLLVPSVSRAIHRANKEAIRKGDEDFFIIPLAGASLGNGWVNGEIQGPSVIDYSWYHGLIDKPTRDALHVEWDNCIARRGSSKDMEPPPFHNFNVVDDCGMMWGVLQAAGNPNAYDSK